MGVEVHGAGSDACIALLRVARSSSERFFLLRVFDLFHGCVVRYRQVELLELADEPTLVAGHGQLMSEAGKSLVTDKADDVELVVQPCDAILVKSPFRKCLLAFLFQAAASTSCEEVLHKIVLIVPSVAQHLCQTQADVILLDIDHMASHTRVNRVKASQKPCFQLKLAITSHKGGYHHITDETHTAYE